MTADEFRKAGLYDPDAVDAAERLALLEWLVENGATLERMIESQAAGYLPFAAAFPLMRFGSGLTREQLAERLGVEHDQLERFRVAFGLPPVADGSVWCNEREAEMFTAVARGVELFGEPSMLRLSRVLGGSVSRVAEAMASMNHERVIALAERSASELEIAKANHEAIRTADAPAAMLGALLGIHLAIAAERQRNRRTHFTQHTLQGCIGFVDLVGSTSVSRRLSARELGEFVDRFEEVANAIATERGGRVVKFIGDEVMFVTGDAAAACDIALSLIESFAGDPSITPRAGLASGSLLDRAGDYYGPVVNLAARLAELAVPREVLVSVPVADASRDRGYRLEPAGRRQLRGFEEPVPVMTVSRLPSGG